MEEINVCICFDNNYYNLGINLIRSIINTTKYNLNKLTFYILVDLNESKKLTEELKNYNIKFNIKEFKPSLKLKNLIEQQKIRYELKNNKVKNPHPFYNYLNYARFYLLEYFPDLDKVIFLDADIKFNKPIEKLYFSAKLTDYYFAAINTKAKFSKWNGTLDYPGLPDIKKEDNQFNAGVYITLLSKWKENKIIEKLEDLMKKNNELVVDGKIKFIYRTGTQPPLNLVFYNQREKIRNGNIYTHYKGYKSKR